MQTTPEPKVVTNAWNAVLELADAVVEGEVLIEIHSR